jgi:hypothetical protein
MSDGINARQFKAGSGTKWWRFIVSYQAEIAVIDPEAVRSHFRLRTHDDLMAAVADKLEAQGIDEVGPSPNAIVGMLQSALATNPIDAPSVPTEGSSTALYLILDTMRQVGDICYTATWSGYDQGLDALGEVLPKWAALLQTSLGRGLFGLVADDWPGCGWISSAEASRVLPTFVEAKKRAYLHALQEPEVEAEAAWHGVREGLEACGEHARWLVHSYG